jgi:imidazole glycerol-phosphate synthase subunit HisH
VSAAGPAPSVTVVDLGLGNLGSVLEGLKRAGGVPVLSSNPREIARAPRVLLPGVAAFGLGMERAGHVGLKPALRAALDRAAPVLGICLGMQLLFEEGDEDGTRKGLGLLPGRVTRLPLEVPQPHIGWQRLIAVRPSPLLASAPVAANVAGAATVAGATITAGESRIAGQAPWAYFAHSYQCVAPDDVVCAIVEHGAVGRPPERIAAVVSRGTLHGAQFHPEKSARGGAELLARFLALPAGAEGSP